MAQIGSACQRITPSSLNILHPFSLLPRIRGSTPVPLGAKSYAHLLGYTRERLLLLKWQTESPFLIVDIVGHVASFLAAPVLFYNISHLFRANINDILLRQNQLNPVLHYLREGDIKNAGKQLGNRQLTARELRCLAFLPGMGETAGRSGAQHISAGAESEERAQEFIIAHSPSITTNHHDLMTRVVHQGNSANIAILANAIGMGDLNNISNPVLQRIYDVLGNPEFGQTERKKVSLTDMYPFTPTIDAPHGPITAIDAFVIMAIASILDNSRSSGVQGMNLWQMGERLGYNIAEIMTQNNTPEMKVVMDLLQSWTPNTSLDSLAEKASQTVEVADQLFTILDSYHHPNYPEMIVLSERAVIAALERKNHYPGIWYRLTSGNVGDQPEDVDVQVVTNGVIDHFLTRQGTDPVALRHLLALYWEYKESDLMTPPSIISIPGRIYARALQQDNQVALAAMADIILRIERTEDNEGGGHISSIMTRATDLVDDIFNYLAESFPSSLAVRILTHQLEKKFRNIVPEPGITWDIRQPPSTARTAPGDTPLEQEVHVLVENGGKILVPRTDHGDVRHVLEVIPEEGKFTYRALLQSIYDYYQEMEDGQMRIVALARGVHYRSLRLGPDQLYPDLLLSWYE